jgi:type VII secretion-associated serine protease mycosin
MAAAALLAVPLSAPGTARADEVRDDEWQFLSAINVQRAWNITKGKGVTVALLDSGVDARQRDLVGSVTNGPDYARGANPAGVAPLRLHGTQMASIIAGHGHGAGDLDGVVGVAPEAKILSLRVLLENEEPGYRYFNTSERYEGTIAKGIRYAVDHGADVINMSLGKSFPTKQERQAVGYAISHGVVMVAAAGNEGASRTARRRGYAPYSFPASFPGVISVAAVTADHRHAGFSNRNSAVVVSAPGVRVVAAGPGNSYYLGDGTSPATAFVSGIAALIRAKYPKLPPTVVTQAIVESATHHPPGGYDLGVGFGEVDAAAALSAAGKLANVKTNGVGLDPHYRLGDAGPVQVVHHDMGPLVGYGAAALAGLVGALLCGLALRRRPAPQPVSGGPRQPWPTWQPPESQWQPPEPGRQPHEWRPSEPGSPSPEPRWQRPEDRRQPPGSTWPSPDPPPRGPAESDHAD